MIRALKPSDREAWESLWQGYLTFYKASLSEEQTQLTWERLLDVSNPIEGLIAEHDGQVVGIAHIQLRPSTWSQHGFLYLEDLFVDPSMRGQGIGVDLMNSVYDRARKLNAGRVYWTTQSDNPARKLYDRFAAESGFVQYRHTLEPA